MPKPLPAQPSVEHLKKQAKDLLKDLKANDPTALDRAHTHHPAATGSSTSWNAATAKLADAQWIVAREYGFDSWTKLKQHVTDLELASGDPLELFHKAFREDDAKRMRQLFEKYPEVKAKINEPVAAFDSPPITSVRSRQMLDVFLSAGADINAKSRWWAGGFGLLHSAEPELAAYAITRGATVDIHAAARLGLMDRVRELVSADPNLVHARGGDGQTPLHFASTIEIAGFLLDHGADVNARDIDHESTPAQYMIKDRQPIARYLVERGCETDLLMAAALGDQALAETHLQRDPECIRMRVTSEFFPMVGNHSGGTIYQWTLGWYVSARQVATAFGHDQFADWLRERSPADVQLIDACWMHDAGALDELLRRDSGLPARLTDSDRRHLANAARNNDLAAVRLFIRAGLPLDRTGQHGATPLHWAAWHGNVKMVELLLQNRAPLEVKDRDFQGTPLRWVVHGSEHGWHAATGDYAAAAEALLRAGAEKPTALGGTERVQAVLRAHGVGAS